MPILPFLIICTVCATLRTHGSDNVSCLSATKDTRPGRTALPLCSNKNLWRQLWLTRAKQPRVMIESGVARLQPPGRRYIRQNGICGLKGP